MRPRCITHLLIFWVLSFSLSAPAEPIKLTAKYLDQTLGMDWKGILYACDPYCRFLSLREDKKWNPVLPADAVESSSLKGIAQTDPLYPLLVERVPVLPYRSEKGQKNGKINEDTEALSVPPAYATLPFNYGWELRLGPKLTQLNSKSNTSVQSEFANGQFMRSYLLSAGIMRAKPFRVFGAWFQQYLEADMAIAGKYETADGIEMSSSGLDVHYQLWYTAPTYKTGLRLGRYQEGFRAATDSIAHYSTDQNFFYLGWGHQWRRFLFRLDTNVTSSFHDGQNFRQAPFEQRWYRAGVDYCSRNISMFDISFGICGLVTYQLDSQKSKLAANVFVDDSSEIHKNFISAAIQLRFGRDFFQ